MGDFTKYLTESQKQYEFRVKIAGELDKGFGAKLEQALQKFEVAKMSAGKSTPIQSLPLDFPALSNEAVTIFDVTTNYPASVREMKEYIADYMRISPAMVVVRRPGEPTEEYQDQMQVAKNSEYRNKLLDLEYTDSAKVDAEDFHGAKGNMGLLKELLKDKKEIEYAEKPKVEQEIQSKEDAPADSPLTKPTNPHPDPKRK